MFEKRTKLPLLKAFKAAEVTAYEKKKSLHLAFRGCALPPVIKTLQICKVLPELYHTPQKSS